MKRIRLVGLCLAAVFAVGAVTSASASAAELPLPALYEACTKAPKETITYLKKGKEKKKAVGTGNYTNKTCTAPAPEGKYREVVEGHRLPEGKYEQRQGIGAGKPFTGKSEGGANLEIDGVGGVHCTASTDEGKFTTPNTAGKILVTFTGCTLKGGQCNNTGKAGEIKTNALKGEVGYLKGKGGPSPVVGVRLSAESAEYDAEFICSGELYLRTIGPVFGEVDSEAVNKLTDEVTLTFEQSAGIQRYRSFEGGAEDEYLETKISGGPFRSNEEGSSDESAEATKSINVGETLELKA